MNYSNELEFTGINNNKVFVIYTNDGPYDTLGSLEDAISIAEMYGLKDYRIVEETILA